jgi:hypothetical protein
MNFNDLKAAYVRAVESFQLSLFVDEDDLTILGTLASVQVEDFLELLPGCFLFNLEDLPCLGSISLGSWETFLFVDELMMLCGGI